MAHRIRINAALIARALTESGGRLVDPTASDVSSLRTAAAIDCKDYTLPFSLARSIADLALYDVWQKDSKLSDHRTDVEVNWADVMSAWVAQGAERAQRASIDQGADMEEDEDAEEEDIDEGPKPQKQDQKSSSVDAVVERVKQSKNLTNMEKQMLNTTLVSAASVASTTFEDVFLEPATIDAVRSVVSLPLLYPEAFKGGVLKNHSTTGALLFGPPGTGKTLLARAVANEGKARMLYVKPSTVHDKYVGESEQKVKAIFSLARKLSPCVIFVDEMDSILSRRRSSHHGSTAMNSTITEFMQEMDGLSSNTDKHVVVLGATNRPYDLDDAVLRRLPRRLLVDLPLEDGRKAILRIMLKAETLADEVSIDWLASVTEGYSGSDLKNVCVSAALSAVKENVRLPWDGKDPAKPKANAEAQLKDKGDKGERVLQKKHFDRALAEIRPSSSEDGSMLELRKVSCILTSQSYANLA